MAIYTLADLHLSLAHPEKSMQVFGPRWNDYEKRLKKNWEALVSEADTVVIPGDISWAMRLSDALPDFAFLDSLPGTKLIGKGNHDFWWTTGKKLYGFWNEHGMHSLHILYNNAYLVENKILCGTRGWFIEEKYQKTVTETDFEKLVNRETERLKISLEAGKKLQEEANRDFPLYVFLHFPPLWGEEKSSSILSLLTKYNVSRCYFGHIHGEYKEPAVREYEGIPLSLISSDHLSFCPLRID